MAVARMLRDLHLRDPSWHAETDVAPRASHQPSPIALTTFLAGPPGEMVDKGD
jgi:hypothetical protein